MVTYENKKHQNGLSETLQNVCQTMLTPTFEPPLHDSEAQGKLPSSHWRWLQVNCVLSYATTLVFPNQIQTVEETWGQSQYENEHAETKLYLKKYVT